MATAKQVTGKGLRAAACRSALIKGSMGKSLEKDCIIKVRVNKDELESWHKARGDVPLSVFIRIAANSRAKYLDKKTDVVSRKILENMNKPRKKGGGLID